MKVMRMLTLLLCLAVCFGAITMTANAAQLSQEDALAYLDGYADHVGNDADFDASIASAVETVRESVSSYATIWALVPPVIAIVLALITKEVYSALFAGILSGALLYSNFHPWGMIQNTFNALVNSICSTWNVQMLIFLVLLGMLIFMIKKSGGATAYGEWAAAHVRSKRGAMVYTCILGVLTFFDDRFSCMMVGTVMRPVTDKYRISREKLAYIIDSTAAPMCILVPLSSWVAVISGVVSDGQGVHLLVRSIPYNLYAFLALFTVFFLSALDFDFGKMRAAERNAALGLGYPIDDLNIGDENPRGTVWDLLVPIVTLIVSCVVTLIYTGGFFDSASSRYLDFVEAFAHCDSSTGLVLGTFVALILTALFYLPRKVITVEQLSDSFVDGFRSMVPAILIQVFAWTLGGMATQLGANIYVGELVRGAAGGLANLLPAILFLIAVGLSFSTGTSWGTFGLLLPIVYTLLPSNELMIISLSACLAGAVCGDHCSPISDTTILASAGADCDHMRHVRTQLTYAMLIASVSFVGYLLAGFVQSAWIVLPVSVAMMAGVILFIRKCQK